MKKRPPTQSAILKMMTLLLMLVCHSSLSFTLSAGNREHLHKASYSSKTAYQCGRHTPPPHFSSPMRSIARQNQQQLHMSSITKILDFVPNSKRFKSVEGQKIDSPLEYVKGLVDVVNTSWETKKEDVSRNTLFWPVSSGQKQLGVMERIGKVSSQIIHNILLYY